MNRRFVRPIYQGDGQHEFKSTSAPSDLEPPDPLERKSLAESGGSERAGRRGEKSISVLLVQDNRLYRKGLAALLRRREGLRLLPDSEWPECLTRSDRGQRPDVVLVDVGSGDMGSLQIVQRTRTTYPESELIAMGLSPIRSRVIALLRSGVSGLLLKDATIHDVVATIRGVAAGQKVFSSSLTEALLSLLVDDARPSGLEHMADGKLTAREGEIFWLIAEGLSNKEIGKRLSIATETVKSHVHNVLEKLSLRSRVEIAALAGRELSAY
jgi:DNA-binding NarL/FixJ family response regulator